MGSFSQCNNTYRRRRRRYSTGFLPSVGWKMESNKFRILQHKMNLFANATCKKIPWTRLQPGYLHENWFRCSMSDGENGPIKALIYSSRDRMCQLYIIMFDSGGRCTLHAHYQYTWQYGMDVNHKMRLLHFRNSIGRLSYVWLNRPYKFTANIIRAATADA